MEPAEAPQTPADGPNSGEILELVSSKRDCCSKKRENRRAGSNRSSTPSCCRIIIRTGCCSKKLGDLAPYEATCLQKPRKCVDVCKQGCCVTVLCDGMRRKICLTIICSEWDTDGKKCCCDLAKNCKGTGEAEICCKSSFTGTTGIAGCASSLCGDTKECEDNAECVVETGCVKETCCSKSDCCSDDSCTTTKEGVEKPCCNDSKKSCSKGKSCCGTLDISTDELSRKVTEEADEESCSISCCKDASKNCCSRKCCSTSFYKEAGDNNKKTCCSKSTCSIDDGCSITKKSEEKSVCNDSKKGCCEKENHYSPDGSTEHNKTSVTSEGNAQSGDHNKKTCSSKSTSNVYDCCSLTKKGVEKPCCEDSKNDCSKGENCCALLDISTDELNSKVTEEADEESCSTDSKTSCCKDKSKNFCSRKCCSTSLCMIARDNNKMTYCSRSTCRIDEGCSITKKGNGKSVCNGSKKGCCEKEKRYSPDGSTENDKTSITENGIPQACCNEPKIGCFNFRRGYCSPKCECCTSCDIKAKYSCCEIKHKYFKPCCEDFTCSCYGGNCCSRLLKITGCCRINVNCSTNCIGDCCHLQYFKHCEILCCNEESFDEPKNNCCPNEVEVDCCINSLQTRNCCKDAFAIKAGCCEVWIVCCPQKSCRVNRDSQGPEKYCCSERCGSLESEAKSNEGCSCSHEKDKYNCCNKETTSVDSTVKSVSFGKRYGRCCKTERSAGGEISTGDNQCCCCKTPESAQGGSWIPKDRQSQSEKPGDNHSCYCFKEPPITKGCCCISLTWGCCTITKKHWCYGCNLKNSCRKNSGSVESASNAQNNCCCTTAGCSDKCDDTCGCKGNDKSFCCNSSRASGCCKA